MGRRRSKSNRLIGGFFREALEGAEQIEPLCPHAEVCGGCSFQHLAYPAQVEAKRDVLRRMILHAGVEVFFQGVMLEAVPGPRPFGYRQRMDYAFAFGNAGLRRRGKFDQVVNLEACHLPLPGVFPAFQRALALVREAGIPSYDPREHVGELRYFVLRATRDGQILLSFVTAGEEYAAEIERIALQLLAEGVAHSIHWLLQPGHGDSSFGEPRACFGVPEIVETICGLRFGIGPNTFAQANPDVAELVYQSLRDFAAEERVETTVDLCCGTGAIGLLLAGGAGEVLGVENAPENLAQAEKNRAANGVTNLRLLLQDAGEFLSGYRGHCDLLILNPPRGGIESRALPAVLRFAPRRIAYLSCNPESLLANLAVLAPVYRVRRVQVFDMFPQTRHFETLVFLERMV